MLFRRPRPLGVFAAVVGILLVLVTLWEAFETMILPRAILRAGRLTHVFYRSTHWFERRVIRRTPWEGFRLTLLGAYGRFPC